MEALLDAGGGWDASNAETFGSVGAAFWSFGGQVPRETQDEATSERVSEAAAAVSDLREDFAPNGRRSPCGVRSGLCAPLALIPASGEDLASESGFVTGTAEAAGEEGSPAGSCAEARVDSIADADVAEHLGRFRAGRWVRSRRLITELFPIRGRWRGGARLVNLDPFSVCGQAAPSMSGGHWQRSDATRHRVDDADGDTDTSHADTAALRPQGSIGAACGRSCEATPEPEVICHLLHRCYIFSKQSVFGA